MKTMVGMMKDTIKSWSREDVNGWTNFNKRKEDDHWNKRRGKEDIWRVEKVGNPIVIPTPRPDVTPPPAKPRDKRKIDPTEIETHNKAYSSGSVEDVNALRREIQVARKDIARLEKMVEDLRKIVIENAFILPD